MQRLNLKEKLTYDEILSLFNKSFKPKDEHKVGMEYERIAISNSTLESVKYDGEFGIREILQHFAKNDNWDYLLDSLNIVGLKKMHDTVTLEPGCQVEYSVQPEKSICDIEQKINKINTALHPFLKEADVSLLNYGVSPVSTHLKINLLPKSRYAVMANYFWGILSDVMMRETAGIQACFDFSDEQDFSEKYTIANLLSPFVTAMFANSPIRGGVDTGYKSFRALAWLYTDSDRCGIFGGLKKDFAIKDYVDEILDTPVIYFVRDDKIIKNKAYLTFRNFIDYGYEGYEATLDDFELHANLCFPDVRLKDFIEIRNQDCVGGGLMYSILALYKGILYDKNARESVMNLLTRFKFKAIDELRYNVPRLALEARISHFKVKDIAIEILKIAEKSLRENFPEEKKYLEAICEYTYNGICPADLILKNWNGLWNKNPEKLIRYLKAI